MLIMKKNYYLLSLLSLLFSLNTKELVCQIQVTPNGLPIYQDGKLYLKIKGQSNVIITSKDTIANDIGDSIKTVFVRYGVTYTERPFAILNDSKLNKTYRLTFSDISHAQNFIADIQQIGSVEYSEQVPAMYTTAVPNDPTQPYHLALVNADPASNIHIANSLNAAVVAIVDDAVLTTHQDLAANVGTLNRDVADLDNNPNPPLTGPTAVINGGNFSHGTHVAGIAGAVTNNGIGVASVGWNNRLMCIKTRNDSDPSGALPFVYDGIAWAAANGAHVINLSVGGFAASQVDYNVMVAAKNLNVVLVAAAGNFYTSTPSYPAAYGEGLTSQPWELIDKRLVVAVAALDANSDISYWGTNGFGMPSGSNFGNWVDIAAYGTAIESTLASSSGGLPVNNLYGPRDGTSMACPIVAGIAGIMRSYNMLKTADEIIDCLLYTANPDIYDPQLHPNNIVGNLGTGRVDADAALRCLGVPCGTSPVAIIAPSSFFICPGGNVTLSANAGVSYQWSTGATTQNINITAPGAYWVIVTFAGGCTSTANITIPPANTQAHIYLTENSGTTPNDGILCGTNFLNISTDYGLSYQWSAFGATSQGVSNINAGSNLPFTWNVSVTVTGLGGCIGAVSTAFATVQWLALPIVTASANPTNVNACSPVILSATGANTYTWNPGSIVGSPVTVLPSATTNYVVTGTDLFGCTNTAAVLVNVTGTGLTSLAVTASNIYPTAGAPITLNAIASPPGSYTYVWSPNIGNTPSVNLTPTDNGVYTCNVTDQCGNTISASTCISLKSTLCSSTSNVTLNNTTFNSSVTYNNQIITVIGNINVLNGTLTFKNCTLKMGTNSRFIVSPVSTIDMVSSQVFSCEGMWFGIDAQSNGSSAATVKIKGCSIEDAYNAVIANNNLVNVNNSITISSTTLNKNYIDISISNASAATSYPLFVQSCNLTSNVSTTSPGNSLKCSGYYPVGASPVKARSYAGLFADRAGVVILTNNNLGTNFTRVSNKDYGLFLRRTDATVYNIQFRDITSTTSLLTPMTGPLPLPVGVSIFSSNARSLIAKPVTTPVNNALLFRNVGYGIITNKTLIVEVVNAEFTNPGQFATPNLPANISTGIGVSAVYTIDADAILRINSNNISRVTNAITATYSLAPKAAGLFSISQNIITAGAGTLNTAIDILSTVNTPFTGTIGNQIVAANQITNAGTAGIRMINVTGSSGLRVSGNTITLRNATSGIRDGILLNGANNNVMIDNNSVDGNLPGNNPSAYNLNCSGIRSVNSPGCFVQCNAITHTGKGVVYSGNNSTGTGGTGAEFFGNILTAPIRRGLELNTGGMIGTQGNSIGASANVWNGFNAANSDQTLIGGPFPFSTPTNAINSVLFVHNITGFSAERPTDNQFQLPSSVGNDYIWNVNLFPASGGNIIGCPIALTTGAKVILTPTLDVTQRNADYSTYITSVVTATSNTAPQAKWMLKQHMHKAIRQTQIGNNTTVANFYATEQNGDAAKYYEVDSLLSEGDTILAKAKNNIAPVNNDIEQTHHDFNQLYLSGITNGTDYAALETIANLCAYKYGNAVYQARALVNIVTYGNRDFEEDCENGEGSRIGNFTEEDNSISVAENIQAHLFPNPNNGNFTLSYDLKQMQEVNIQIIDITGKVVYLNTIDNLNNLVQINIQDLHSGMYFIQLLNKDNLLWTDKVMISK